ncbi:MULTISPECIES: efflux RND transporter periplasmic adaptor subunit [Marinobacter]|uniref:HlyD family efflux transporter periplasmic adaptor subunit n=1 Tax=Marinobacter suaedae TaxID=3057675 RepID=A0ABT8VZZ6_9GAMM|nr:MULTISPECIES: HlyD family efflux transporter periplasmic adaptor subunit [unclassified Marinobacter]MBZ2169742.1 HlyD family efflux transporter periplasmic adaptor subunit [Marinobacter sp. F4216]MDO3721565.1 HlyD family efflux transporter periplasmic adaptor subunit [Marinobacter sp. chi1]
MSKRFLPLIILAIGIAGYALLRMTRPEPAEVTATERSWRVTVQAVEPGTHTPVLPLYGQVVAPESITVTAALEGRIEDRPVVEGQQVQAGDLLIALAEADIRPKVAQAEAQVADLQAQLKSEEVRYQTDLTAVKSERAIRDNARRQFERTQSLVKRNLASQENLDTATDALARAELTVAAREQNIADHPARVLSLEARLAQAEANLATTRRDAERARMTAPFDGVVTDVQVAPGDQVARNQVLLSLYPLEGLELRARVPARYIPELQGALSRGDTLMASSKGGHRFELDRFSGIADPAGTEAILIQAGDPSGLRPGELLPVNLERPERDDSVTIPFAALYGADSVYLVNEEDRMRRVDIERIGEAMGSNGERWLLVAGEELTRGTRLVTTHLPNALTGLKVEPVDAAEGADQ